MGTRVALLACVGTAEGPWTIAKGNEAALKVVHLMEGEHVRVEIMVGDLQDQITYDSPGVFPLPWKRIDRYRVCKVVDDGVSGSPTTVEVVLDAPQSISWGADNPERRDGQQRAISE